jgi:hypothetical protein
MNINTKLEIIQKIADKYINQPLNESVILKECSDYGLNLIAYDYIIDYLKRNNK